MDDRLVQHNKLVYHCPQRYRYTRRGDLMYTSYEGPESTNQIDRKLVDFDRNQEGTALNRTDIIFLNTQEQYKGYFFS